MTVAKGLPVETIVWVDAAADLTSEAYLADLTGFGNTVVCLDVGFLVRETSKFVVLAGCACADDNSVRQSNTIPKSLIIARYSMGDAIWPESTIPPTI